MEEYQVDTIARFATALGETLENTRLIERLPSLATLLVNSATRLVAENISKQLAEQSGDRVNIKIQHQDVDLRDVVAEGLVAHAREENKQLLESAKAAALMFRLPARWESKIERILGSIETTDVKTLEVQVRELIWDFCEELKEPLFLYVPPTRRRYFDQNEPPFGELVADKFPNAARDIAAAARCFALDEWTACVSHLMRSLEEPLQLFASRVGVTFPGPTDLENWKNIVDQMVSRIDVETKRLEGTAKSHVRNQELQLLGDVALDFRHFKNAWRNNVAHGRDWYDEREAERVYGAVRHFMQKMAEIA